MRLFRRSFRSGGIRVDAAVHRHVRLADVARDEGNWPLAAHHYQLAVAERPDLLHIRIQLGHALKEMGDRAGAEAAYRQAAREYPGDRDASLHLGHMLKVTGRPGDAALCYMRLFLADRNDLEAIRELRQTLPFVMTEERHRLATEMMNRLPSDDTLNISRITDLPDRGIVFDVSDLLSYFGHSQRPTGIQRVQIETVLRALTPADSISNRCGVCCFIAGRDEWVAVPEAAFIRLVRSSVDETLDDETWQRQRDHLLLWLLLVPPFRFPHAATLVNLGTSWWLQNYFLRVRHAQISHGVSYIPMVYDMIPVLFPEYCIDTLVQDFIAWLTGVFAHTDRFLAISEASKRDLIATADQMGYELDPAKIVVVPLNADFADGSQPDQIQLPIALSGTGFVLFVSTIEPRKGHLVAFEAWSRLLTDLGAINVPKLVCVGRQGWRNAAVHDRLRAEPALADHVVMLSDLSDAMLASLYSHSLFTIYPSLYEGWGLPVTEALCRGKVVITTTSSSLPEAGQRFAIYVPPSDATALASAVKSMIVDPDARQQRQQMITDNYRPRGWHNIAEQMIEAVSALRPDEAGTGAPSATARAVAWDVFQWLGRSRAMVLRGAGGNGEIYRAGVSWQVPEDWGCRVAAAGGRLAFFFADELSSDDQPYMELRLVGSERGRCSFRVAMGQVVRTGTLAKHERLSLLLPLETGADRLVEVDIAGSTSADTAALSGGSERPEMIGVEGFAVHRRSPRLQ